MSEAAAVNRGVWRWLGLIGGFVALLGLLFWLFSRAEQVALAPHNDYMQSLGRVQQADIELNAAVLANYSGLLHNYDPLVRHVADIGAEEASLLAIPGSLAAADRNRLQALVERLLTRLREKAGEVDRFKRSRSVLRNSEMYFPRAAEEILHQAGQQAPEELERFVRRVMALSAGAPLAERQQLSAELEHLRRQNLQIAGPLSLNQLLVHAEQIIELRPEVDALVGRLLDPSSRRLLEEVSNAYIEGYEGALRNASRYRQALYLATVLLVAYALYALLRFERDRRKLIRVHHHLAAAHHDLAERYAAQLAAESQVRLLATVFTNSTEGMTITDAEARIIAVNPAFSAITGYSAEEAVGRTPAVLKSGRHGDDYYRAMWWALHNDGHWQGEIWNRNKDGEVYPEWLSIAAVHDDKGATTHYIGIFIDISERKLNEARIDHLAHHDVLTDLPNRLLLEDRARQAMLKAKRSGKPMAVIFVDLDRFKNINDTLGHEIGDQLLVQAAQRGLSVLRDTDTLSRQGGDEFVIILAELEQRQDAMQVARKLLAALNQPYLLAGHELTVTGSAGIALYPDDGQTLSELLRKADAAMYRAKAEGRNTCCFFSAEIDTASLGELLLESELYGALGRGELLLHYQPKIDAASGRLVGIEALMRWQHPTRGMVPPSIFIPIAEANGLIHSLGEWAIRTVCAQQRSWLDAGLATVPVAVNISAQQFAQQDLPQIVAGALAEYALPAHLLELELTESLLMRNAGRAAEVLDTLRRLNIKVAIDDFGTGYSSLSYLKQFPVQVLKIDRAFICEIDETGERVKLASAIIAMAHELDLAVVAEGVETTLQRDYLRRHGCDQFQGYLFGHPMSAAELAKRLAAGCCREGEQANVPT